MTSHVETTLVLDKFIGMLLERTAYILILFTLTHRSTAYDTAPGSNLSVRGIHFCFLGGKTALSKDREGWTEICCKQKYHLIKGASPKLSCAFQRLKRPYLFSTMCRERGCCGVCFNLSAQGFQEIHKVKVLQPWDELWKECGISVHNYWDRPNTAINKEIAFGRFKI